MEVMLMEIDLGTLELTARERGLLAEAFAMTLLAACRNLQTPEDVRDRHLRLLNDEDGEPVPTARPDGGYRLPLRRRRRRQAAAAAGRR
jgi:hypothetical protein